MESSSSRRMVGGGAVSCVGGGSAQRWDQLCVRGGQALHCHVTVIR